MINLKRVRWLEELELIRIFVFVSTRPDTMVSIEGVEMTQNQWVYSQVMRFIRPERVALFNRFYSRLNDPTLEFGLPKQLDNYWVLEFLNKPPKFVITEATVFHHFVPKRTQPTVKKNID